MLKRNTAVLLALALGLALVVLVLNQVDRQQQEQQQQESRLFTFAPEEVAQIRIETPAEEEDEDPQVIQLALEGDTWQVQEPISSAADVFTVDSLLQTASELQPAEDLEQTGQASDLEQFGLDPAQEILSFTLREGETQTLTLGNMDFDGTGIYALSKDDQLVTIPRSAQGRLSPNLFSLRDKTLLSLQRDQIQSIEIQKSTAAAPDAEQIQLTQTDSGWQIQAPRLLRVDQAAVDQLVNPLLSLQASGFAAETQEDLDSYGLDQPQTELIITLAPSASQESEAETETETETREEPIRIAFGSTDDMGAGVYAITSTTSTVATVPTATAQGLQPTLSQLRDKQMAQIDPEQVAEVTIEAQEEDLSRSLLPTTATPTPEPTPEEEEETEEPEVIEDLASLDPTETEPAEAAERLWEISDQDRLVNLDPLFTALNQAQARTFLSPQDPRAERALEDPLFSLRFDLEEEEDDLLFRFAEDEDQIYAEVPGRGDILILERTALNSIRSALEDLKPE